MEQIDIISTKRARNSQGLPIVEVHMQIPMGYVVEINATKTPEEVNVILAAMMRDMINRALK